MLKTIVTLMRGRASEAGQRLADRHALSILDQQMRDATAAVERARRALAVARAQEGAGQKRLDATRAAVADLEERAIAALRGGREDLAKNAAEAIAALEADATAAETASSLFRAEISRLEDYVRRQGVRLSELERGRRIARAAEAVRSLRRGRIEAAPCAQSTLSEAEATLARLRRQQAEAETAEAALDALESAPAAETVAETLAREGFGKSVRPDAAEILARLKARSSIRQEERKP